MITVSNEKGTFSVSAEDFAGRFQEYWFDNDWPGYMVKEALLDFLQGYEN